MNVKFSTKFVAASAAAVMALSLAGCSGGSMDDSSSSSAKASGDSITIGTVTTNSGTAAASTEGLSSGPGRFLKLGALLHGAGRDQGLVSWLCEGHRIRCASNRQAWTGARNVCSDLRPTESHFPWDCILFTVLALSLLSTHLLGFKATVIKNKKQKTHKKKLNKTKNTNTHH